ncbi:MAG: type toxin-antitoxin system prevent-host-death family antitoxin [Acidobacteria bacterium]|nr:type toxin-antitoxin system prevent-host-death family antitoxin [Acidobacteriota bacterium]
MGKAITAAAANRDFSKLLRDVRNGNSIVITNHGKPVAKLVPFVAQDRLRDSAKATLLAHLDAQPAIDAGRWSRADLYQRD